jgi:membrane-associated protein
MHYVRFVSFNVFGAIGWVTLMIMLGYSLGNNTFVRHNFEKVVLGIIVVSLIPAAIQILQKRKAPADREVSTPAAR